MHCVRSDSRSFLLRLWSSISTSIYCAMAAVASRLAPARVRASSSFSCTDASDIPSSSYRSCSRSLSSRASSSSSRVRVWFSSNPFIYSLRMSMRAFNIILGVSLSHDGLHFIFLVSQPGALSFQLLDRGRLLDGIRGDPLVLFFQLGDGPIPRSDFAPLSHGSHLGLSCSGVGHVALTKHPFVLLLFFGVGPQFSDPSPRYRIKKKCERMLRERNMSIAAGCSNRLLILPSSSASSSSCSLYWAMRSCAMSILSFRPTIRASYFLAVALHLTPCLKDPNVLMMVELYSPGAPSMMRISVHSVIAILEHSTPQPWTTISGWASATTPTLVP